MMVSSGLTVPVAVTARVTGPRVTGTVTYSTVPLFAKPSHATAAPPIAATRRKSPASQRRLERRAVDGRKRGMISAPCAAGGRFAFIAVFPIRPALSLRALRRIYRHVTERSDQSVDF